MKKLFIVLALLGTTFICNSMNKLHITDIQDSLIIMNKDSFQVANYWEESSIQYLDITDKNNEYYQLIIIDNKYAILTKYNEVDNKVVLKSKVSVKYKLE